MPTYDATEAFRRAFSKLDARTAAAFLAAVALFVRGLDELGFAPPFHPSLRVHKPSGLEMWSLSFAGGVRAVFRVAAPVVEGEVHAVWEFIGDHAPTSGSAAGGGSRLLARGLPALPVPLDLSF